MTFWITVIFVMILANLATAGLVALGARLLKKRKLQLTKIERGNAAFEHILAAQNVAKAAPSVTPFPKKVE